MEFNGMLHPVALQQEEASVERIGLDNLDAETMAFIQRYRMIMDPNFTTNDAIKIGMLCFAGSEIILGRDDLPLVTKAADQAHTWIFER